MKFPPCFVAVGRTETQILLDLIMLNATARVMTDAEKFLQFEKITELFSHVKTLFGSTYLLSKFCFSVASHPTSAAIVVQYRPPPVFNPQNLPPQML